MTTGTRGDLEPFVALGRGLRAAGHEVIVCTHQRYRASVESAGLGYAYMNDDILELLDTPEGRAVTENQVNLFKMLMVARRLWPIMKPMQARQMTDLWHSAQQVQPDAIVYHPKAAGLHFAEKLGVPAVLATLQPMFVPTAEAPALLFPALPLGARYNRWTYRCMEWFTKMGTGKVVRDWRRSVGLADWNGRSLTRGDASPVPVVHLWSPTVTPRPADWPPYAQTTGYCFPEATANYQPPPELAEFLRAGPPPIYIGFGSITGAHARRRTQMILKVLRETKTRAVLGRGWGGIDPGDETTLPDNVILIDAVPHQWLFEHVAATIHHGGCGTTHTALRAGKPTLVCPFFADQPYWGARVAAIGAGPRPIPIAKLNAKNLRAAILQITTDEPMRAKAAAIGAAIRAEDGVGMAVRVVESHL